jgi:hypothetical protein
MTTTKLKKKSPWMKDFVISKRLDDAEMARCETMSKVADYRNTLKKRGR